MGNIFLFVKVGRDLEGDKAQLQRRLETMLEENSRLMRASPGGAGGTGIATGMTADEQQRLERVTLINEQVPHSRKDSSPFCPPKKI